MRRQADAVRLSTAVAGVRRTASSAPRPRDRTEARSEAADQAAPAPESTSRRPKDAARRSRRTRIGVISDTHGYLDPAVADLFAGVTHIVHAGDIGDRSVLTALEAMAPVTAVAGNLEPEALLASLPRDAAGKVGSVRFVVAHKRKRLFKRLAAGKLPAGLDEVPGLVIYGHDHVPASSWVEGTLFLNPGTASAPDDEDDDPTVAVVEDSGSGLAVAFFPLRRRDL
jgi:putative phosphoesterase